MKLTKNERALVAKTCGVIRAALTKLDERGTDDTVTEAMTVVFAISESARRGTFLSPENAYRRAMKARQ